MSSARRRARVGGVARASDGVPAELVDPDHKVWSDPVAVAKLAEKYGVNYSEPGLSSLRDPYWERFKEFRRAYATAYGFLVDEYALDLRHLRSAGVFADCRSPRWRFTGDDVVPI